jgi:hypothetical protein
MNGCNPVHPKYVVELLCLHHYDELFQLTVVLGKGRNASI